MDSNERSKITAFDTLFSDNHIQMLKVILPYMDNQTQKSMAVYIKFLELNYTLRFYKKRPYSLCGVVRQEPQRDFMTMCTELLPFCSKEEKRQIEQIRSIMQNMDMYRDMMKTMEVMKEFMPDMSTSFNAASSDTTSSNEGAFDGTPFGGGPFGGGDIMGMLMNMLTPEQKQMYELFGGNANAE